jgi:hypothetical protein
MYLVGIYNKLTKTINPTLESFADWKSAEQYILHGSLLHCSKNGMYCYAVYDFDEKTFEKSNGKSLRKSPQLFALKRCPFDSASEGAQCNIPCDVKISGATSEDMNEYTNESTNEDTTGQFLKFGTQLDTVGPYLKKRDFFERKRNLIQLEWVQKGQVCGKLCGKQSSIEISFDPCLALDRTVVKTWKLRPMHTMHTVPPLWRELCICIYSPEGWRISLYPTNLTSKSNEAIQHWLTEHGLYDELCMTNESVSIWDRGNSLYDEKFIEALKATFEMDDDLRELLAACIQNLYAHHTK